VSAKARLAAMLIAAAFLGVHGLAQTPSANEPGSAEFNAPANTEKRTIADPSMHGMKAVEVTIPAKWHFQSDMYLAGESETFMRNRCISVPTGVFRATSPDGLSFVEQMPVAAWGWFSGTNAASHDLKDCFPLQGPTSAQDFLKYLSATLNVEYIADEAVPLEQNAKMQNMVHEATAKYSHRENFPVEKWTEEPARAVIRYKNGTFTMKGRLNVQVNCSERIYPEMKANSPRKPRQPPTTVNTCLANIVYVVAPEKQYAELIEQWDRPGMGARQLVTWLEARIQQNDASSLRWSLAQSFIRNEERLSWKGKLHHSLYVWRKIYTEFNVTVQQGLDKAMAHSAEAANSNRASTPDWVDDLLEENPVTDTKSGETHYESSPYNQWTDGTGTSYYQTIDVNASPNGILPGTWTRRQIVHSDGTQ
jgi:hypothetical protein